MQGRGQFAQQQFARSSRFRQPERQQLRDRRDFMRLLRRLPVERGDGRFDALAINPRAEFAEGLERARKMFGGAFSLSRRVSTP